jgi:iron complex transport system substrate-binding protein
VTVFAQARRVISIIPATTEMLFAMGAGDRVIAIGSYDHYPPEAQKLPRVGALIDPNVEQILQMRPDLVVLYSTQTELRRRLERANIPYYSYMHKGLGDITQTIRSLGSRVGVEDAANILADRIEKQLADIRERVANRPRPKTLLVFEPT